MGVLAAAACALRRPSGTALPSHGIRIGRAVDDLRRGALGGLAAAVVVLILPACSIGQGDAPETASSTPTISTTPTPTATTTPTPDPSADAAKAALATYRSYWDAVVKARAIPDPESRALRKYGGDTALANEQSYLVVLEREGVAYRGRPVLEPTASLVALGDIPEVTIEDCIDSSGWKPIRLATGKSALAPDQDPRVLTTSRVEYIGNRWLVVSVDSDRSRKC